MSPKKEEIYKLEYLKHNLPKNMKKHVKTAHQDSTIVAADKLPAETDACSTSEQTEDSSRPVYVFDVVVKEEVSEEYST